MMQSRQAAAMAVLSGNAKQSRMKLSGRYPGDGNAADSWCPPQSRLSTMASQLLSIQECERKRIATDLHDGLGQSLTLIKLTLAATARLLASGAITEAAESLRLLNHKAHDALEEMRRVSMDLRPPMLDDLGILATLSWLFRELEGACPGMKVEKDFSVQESCIPGALKITIYRIIQEATSNIIRHANADRVRVSIGGTREALHLEVADNGAGFDPAGVAVRNGSKRGLGLLNMRERASLSGGAYTIDSRAGKGTQISVSWQLDSIPEFL
jgi:signal transduction histidine kinase